ncbi:MAG: hypothetical protein KAW39_00750 [Thermoplasmata archaeon]|nr:hypothetical protein [Thermoplasmata archaeon]
MSTTIAISDELHHKLRLIKAKEGFKSMEELTRHLVRDHERHASPDEFTYEEVKALAEARETMRARERLLKQLE